MSGPNIRLQCLLATHYQHPNLSEAHRFFTDFGLIEAQRSDDKIYYRGFGHDPYIYIAEKGVDGKAAFLGGIWVVASLEDLETASKVPNASPVQSSSAPGGGKFVKLIDPTGIPMTLVHGIQSRPQPDQDMEKPEEQIVNSWDLKPRKGRFQRPPKGPSKVHKLGHYGIMVEQPKWEQTVQWYENLFNLTTSDIVYEPNSGKDFMCFVHIDLGTEYTDHHSLFFHASHGPVEEGDADHSSFEVDNLDTQLMGRQYLESQGWTNCWGIGRHKLGSQIFDYWFDASGFIVEHYSDGDLVNNQTKPTRQKLAPDTMASWGPKITRAMMTKRIEDVVKA